MTIRSVLIAGMHNEANSYVGFCEDMLLKWEHLPELRGGRIPMDHDAVIIVVAQASKELIHEVTAAYQGMGKPIFKTAMGTSEFRHKFELEVFGSEANIRILRCPIDQTNCVPIQDRMWWAVSRVLRPGDELRLRNLQRFAEKFVIKGHDKAISNVWYRGRDEGVFRESRKKGYSIFVGIPPVIADKILNHNLPLEDESMTVIVRQKSKSDDAHVHRLEKLFKPASVPEPVEEEELEPEREPEKFETTPIQTSAETEAMIQLLLESMAKTQANVDRLMNSIEKIPELIRSEMATINVVVNSIQPELVGMNPDELKNIYSMIELMKSMRGRK